MIDKVLIERFNSSKGIEPFTVLFTAHYGELLAYCKKYLKELSTAEDAVQDIYLKLIKKLDTITLKPDTLRAWFYRVAFNHCMDILRSKRVFIDYFDDVFVHFDSDLRFEYEEEEDEFLQHQINIVENCLAQLKNPQRQCIKDFYINRYTYVEVAENYGFEVSKVRSYIQNGKRNLKQCVEFNLNKRR